ncbi:unnamed protein product [Rangifer tarandus platyrhynchus]|uniref:Uncharacterized protein n=1 Tax=Rangifer tarandus platyrhynchus TaxID=3082113 RepID=A0AC59ZWQ4_RANTA
MSQPTDPLSCQGATGPSPRSLRSGPRLRGEPLAVLRAAARAQGLGTDPLENLQMPIRARAGTGRRARGKPCAPLDAPGVRTSRRTSSCSTRAPTEVRDPVLES